MLSGIGPKEHLADCKIECLVDRPGVGRNLQDRYEVGVVSEMKQPFALLKDATFKPPAAGESGDPVFRIGCRARASTRRTARWPR